MYNELVPTTELEAVNALLEHIGEAEVSSLEDLALDAASARNTLRRVSREVQARGWHWNTSVQKLIRNSNNEYLLPVNCIRVDTVGNSADVNVIRRGKRLFDRRDFKNTYKFDEESLDVRMISLLDFEELPESARQYIYIRAARQFQELNLGSRAISEFTQDDEMYALTTLMDEEMDTGDYNMGQNLGPAAARFPIGFRSF